MALLAAGVVVIAWLGFQLLGERGRTTRCGRNLAVLGQAIQGFANDHGGALPPAYVARTDAAWSFLIAPYVPGGPAMSNTITAKWEWEEGIRGRLVCPSDPVLRGYPRSYAMAAHDMRLESWPPDGEEYCGVGLVWNAASAKRLLEQEVTNGTPADVTGLAWIKPARLPDPANTLLLTELIHPGNKIKSGARAVVRGPEEQVEELRKQNQAVHFGRFQYLMVDGHVETLRPYQAETFSGTAGIWTMRRGD